MARRIATVGGYAIRPGVSRNGRLYTRDMIARMVDRAQQRIADSSMPVIDRSQDTRPLSQRTHHNAEDDVTRIVGRVTGMTLESDGSARFTADIADTPHGRTIASLMEPHNPSDPDSVPPFLKGVSIRGTWMGRARKQRGPSGEIVETGDDLELDGLDYTGKPGVPGSEVDTYEPAAASMAARETEDGRVLIFESVQEAHVDVIHEPVEEADKKPYGDVQYADPGYQADKVKRYPLDSKAHAKSAWAYVNTPKNARQYSSNQLKRIKQRIKSALKKFGVEVSENWLVDPVGQVTESDMAELAGSAGSFCVSLTNGPVTVTVSSYCVDPHDLDLIGRAAMDGACKALAAIDPDMDGDMDVPGAAAEDTDDSMESTESAHTEQEQVEEADADTPEIPEQRADDEAADEDAAPAPDADHEEKEAPAMAEPTPAVEQTADTTPKTEQPDALSVLGTKFDAFTEAMTALVSKLVPAPAAAAAESAPEAPVTETEQPKQEVTESEEDRITRLVAEGIKAAMPQAVQEHVEQNGPPTRKGLVKPVTESDASPVQGHSELPEGWPNKPLHEYTTEERQQYLQPFLSSAVLKDRA